MIEPPPCATIFGAAARQVSNVVPRWASSRSWNCALVTLRIDSLASPAVPAQFTRMSMLPNSCMHAVDQRVGDGRVRGGAGVCDRAGDALRRFGRRVGVTSVDHDTRALRGQQLGHRQTDAASAADDDGAAAGERPANRPRPPERASSCPCSSSRAGWSAGRRR